MAASGPYGCDGCGAGSLGVGTSPHVIARSCAYAVGQLGLCLAVAGNLLGRAANYRNHAQRRPTRPKCSKEIAGHVVVRAVEELDGEVGRTATRNRQGAASWRRSPAPARP